MSATITLDIAALKAATDLAISMPLDAPGFDAFNTAVFNAERAFMETDALDANGLAWKLRNMADEIEYHDPGELAEIEELPRWAARLINDIRRIVGIN